jgi:hypothetical protein
LAVRRASAALLIATLLVSGAAVAPARNPGHGSATQIEHGQCVKRTRDDERSCLAAATLRCREHFETDLVGCFRSNADCPQKCLAAHTKCRGEPKAGEDGCKRACASDLKVELEECQKRADQRGCEGPARVKTLKCKQKCSADSAPKLQECIADFDECIGICVRSATP